MWSGMPCIFVLYADFSGIMLERGLQEQGAQARRLERQLTLLHKRKRATVTRTEGKRKSTLIIATIGKRKYFPYVFACFLIKKKKKKEHFHLLVGTPSAAGT